MLRVEKTASSTVFLPPSKEGKGSLSKISSVMQKALYLFELLFQAAFCKVLWTLRNGGQFERRRCLGTFSSKPNITSSSPFVTGETKEVFTQFVALSSAKTKEKGIKKLNQSIKKGTCHGQCLTLIEMARKNPAASLAELLPELVNNKERIGHHQAMELVRYHFGTNDKGQELKPFRLMPDQEGTRITFDEKGTSEEVIQALENKSAPLMIVRGWKTGKFAHTCLLKIDADKGEHSLYDPAGALFTFKSEKELYIQTVKLFNAAHSALSKGSRWQIESFNMEQVI